MTDPQDRQDPEDVEHVEVVEDSQDLPAPGAEPGLDEGEAAWEPGALPAPSAAALPDEPAEDERPVASEPSPALFAEHDEDVLPGELVAPSAVPGREPRGLVRALTGLVVVLALLAAFLGYQVWQHRGPAPVEASRVQALDAGREAARLVFSYDYRRLQKDFEAGRAVTTGKFRKDYDSTTKRLIGDAAPRYKAVLVAEVSEASVITATEDRVLLLVFLNVQSTSSLTSAPKVTPRRLKMTMQRSGGSGGRWLVADVDAF